jgi:hypothetical protein
MLADKAPARMDGAGEGSGPNVCRLGLRGSLPRDDRQIRAGPSVPLVDQVAPYSHSSFTPQVTVRIEVAE